MRRRRGESGVLSLLSFVPTFFFSPSHARARDRAERGVESRARGHPFSVPLSSSPREYTTTTRRSRVIPLLERELRGLGHAVGSRDPPSFSSARIVRGGGRARARAPLREITAGYAVDPRAAAAAARNRVNASPVVLLVHLGRRPGRRETAGLSSSLVVDRFIHDSPRIRGRVSRALVTGERPTIARTRAPGTAARKQSLVT